jgi:hypothetical protein
MESVIETDASAQATRSGRLRDGFGTGDTGCARLLDKHVTSSSESREREQGKVAMGGGHDHEAHIRVLHGALGAPRDLHVAMG